MRKLANMPKRAPLRIFCLLWLAFVGSGFVSLLNFASAPGRAGSAQTKWIECRSLALATPLPTLIMIVHPQCPCSRASISELGVVMARCNNKLKAYVLFANPSHSSQGSENSELWRRANEIPGVSAVVDENGSTSRQFNAATSGQCYLYDGQGNLSFSGGITQGRGHEGDNIGVDTITACVNRNSFKLQSTPVFGCPLFGAQLATGYKQ